MTETIYYDAVKRNGYFWGRLYKYDASGDKVIVVWGAPHPQQEERHAIDDAVSYADENGLEVLNGQ